MKTATKVAGFTAEGVFVKLSVPEGMDAALQGLTREVLRHQPRDIYWFAAQYFESLIRARTGGRVDEVTTCVQSVSRVESSSSVATGVAALAATTGTVAVLATASASSQSSAPPCDKSHSTTTTSERVDGDSSSQSSQESSKHDGVNPEKHGDRTKAKKNASKRRAKKGGKEVTSSADKTHITEHSTHEETKETSSKVEISSVIQSSEVNSAFETFEGGEESESSKFGDIKRQMNSIAQELAHDTVLKTEKISQSVSEQQDHVISIDSTNSQRDESHAENVVPEEKRETKYKPGTRKLKRQARSVDSSFSDKSESSGSRGSRDSKTKPKAKLKSEVVDKKIEKSAVVGGNILQHENGARVLIEESSELRQLHDWANGGSQTSVTNTNELLSGSLRENESKLGLAGDTQALLSQAESIQNESSIVETEELSHHPIDMKSEELRIETEGSTRKSSAHDLQEDIGSDGSHTTKEEKVEETMEEKREASEKTILERKSNVQVDENGDTVEEEITIIRTEQSSKHETTVSKSWTMETTIETLEDGETRVIERMILHTPPPGQEVTDPNKEDDEGQQERKAHEENLTENVSRENMQLKSEHDEVIRDQNILESTVLQEEQLSSFTLKNDQEVRSNGDIEREYFDESDIPSPITVEQKKEFGLIDSDEARKSLEQITTAITMAEKSLDKLQKETISAEEKAVIIVNEKNDTESVEISGSRVEGPLIDVEMVKKDPGDKTRVDIDEDCKLLPKNELNLTHQENLIHTLGPKAEELTDLKQFKAMSDKDQHGLNDDYLIAMEKQTLVEQKNNLDELLPDISSKSKGMEVDEDGNEILTPEFGLIDPEEAKRSIEQIAVALAKAEESLDLKQSTVETPDDRTDLPKTEVDENGKDIENPKAVSIRQTDDKSAELSLWETNKTDLNPKTDEINNLESKPSDFVLPLGELNVEQEPNVSKEGSKEDTSSDPKETSFHAPDYPTDEDQATPRDDVESLRADTPEESSATKNSSGSDENGDPINPPTVVISRTADVIELKDGEANIITQMEKEGLVLEEGINTTDEPVEKVITRGALQILAEQSDPRGSESDVMIMPKVAEVIAVSTMPVSLGSFKDENVPQSDMTENENDIEDDSVEVVSADFSINQFLHKEAHHSSLLLVDAPEQSSQNNNIIRDTCLSGDEKIEGNKAQTKSDTSWGQNAEHTVSKPSSDPNIENKSLEMPETHFSESKVDTEKKRVLLQKAEFERTFQENDVPPHVADEKKMDESSNETTPSGGQVDESGNYVMKTKLHRSLEVDENGKPIPVDENGKPMYGTRKKRSLDDKRGVSIAKDIIPATSLVRLSSTGSIVGANDDSEHWYGSQMSLSSSTLIKPVLAMSRDSNESLPPCDEPKCIAIDVREKDKDMDIFHAVSFTSSAAGQAILAESNERKVIEPVRSTPAIREGMDVMKEMSRVTSYIGQSILSLGSEEEKTNTEKVDIPAPPRSDSQDSFIISEDAVYIPLNPSGMKRPELERIDSVVSLETEPSLPPSYGSAAKDNLHAVSQKDTSSPVDGNVGSQIFDTTAVIESVAHIHSGHDSESDSEFLRDNLLQNITMSDEHQEDDVLIVKYPSDPNAKVTKWDNVVVTSPADLREEQMNKEEVVPQMESMHVEQPSQFSMDDSLQEVPSLQDEAVLHVESESELLDSMPEEETERKWTDDVSKVTSKAKDIVKGIFSRESSIRQDERIHESQTDVVRASVTEDGSALGDVVDKGTSIANDLEKEVIKIPADIANAVTTASSEVEHRIDDSVSNLKGEVAATCLNVEDKVGGIIDDAQKVSTELSAQVENAAAESAASINALMDNACAKSNDLVGAVKDEIESAASKLEKGSSAVDNFLDNSSRVLSDVAGRGADAEERVETALTELKDLAKSSADTVGKNISDKLSSGVQNICEDVEGTIKSVSQEATDKVSRKGDSVLSDVEFAGKRLRDELESDVSGAKEELVHGVSRALPDLHRLEENIKHDVTSAADSSIRTVLDHSKLEQGFSDHVAQTVSVAADTTKGIISGVADDLDATSQAAQSSIAKTTEEEQVGNQTVTNTSSELGSRIVDDVASAMRDLKSDIATSKDNLTSLAFSATDQLSEELTSVGFLKELNASVPSNETDAIAIMKEVTKSTISNEGDISQVSRGESVEKQSDLTKAKCVENTIEDSTTSAQTYDVVSVETEEATKIDPHSGLMQEAKTDMRVEDVVESTDAESTAHVQTSDSSSILQSSESLTRQVQEEARNVVRSAVEIAQREETELHQTFASVQHETVLNTETRLQMAEDATVAALEIAEASVQEALNKAEITISSEAQKAQSLIHTSTKLEDTRLQERHESIVVTKESGAEGESKDKECLPNEKDAFSGENLTIESSGMEQAVETLKIAEESVIKALTKAEETISSQATKGVKKITSGVEVEGGKNDSVTGYSNSKNETNEEICTDDYFHSSENQVSKSDESESANTESLSTEKSRAMEKTVSATTFVHKFSDGMHEKVRRNGSSLSDLAKDRTRDKSQDGSSRKRRPTTDITSRKAPAKSDSWESNLRKSTVSSTGKMTRNASVGGGKKTQYHSTRNSKIPTMDTSQEDKVALTALETKRKISLRKSKSMSEDSSEETKKRVKKMPSQGSTKKTAISVESVVEAAGETVVKHAIERAKTSLDSGDDIFLEDGKSLKTSSSIEDKEARQRSPDEVKNSKQTSKTELVQAAAAIQDAFRGISGREQRVSVEVDENGKEVVPPSSQRAFQIEPVMEETAEEVSYERQTSSRRGSRQDSQSADCEDTSTSDSSLSSAATKIQAGFRGYLARRHRLHGRHGTTSTGTGDLSMSRDSDVGVVRAMSLMEDSEVQRHRGSPLLDQLPEADGEYGPAKYVADMHRAKAEQGEMGSKGVEWARSLDSGLSSGPERHTPVRSAMSVQQRAREPRDLDEQVWRTLEQEMLAAESVATDDSEGGGVSGGGRRRLSTRRGLHRGNAMQLPTTSSSTPGSLEELRPPGAPDLRHSGEFHDMLVLPLHSGSPRGSPGPSRAGFSLNGPWDAGVPTSPSAQPRAPAAGAARSPPLSPASPAAPEDPEERDMKTADAAATRIQAGFRGYKVRRQLREKQCDGAHREARDARDACEACDAKPEEGAASSEPPAPSAAADADAQPQCRSSIPMVREAAELAALYEAGGAALDEELLQRSAARIQAGVRGFLVRRRQQNAAMAAAKIQAGFRGYRTRRDLRLRNTKSVTNNCCRQAAK